MAGAAYSSNQLSGNSTGVGGAGGDAAGVAAAAGDAGEGAGDGEVLGGGRVTEAFARKLETPDEASQDQRD